MALTGYENKILATSCGDIFLTSRHYDLTSQHKNLTSRHNYLRSDGRNMPLYLSKQDSLARSHVPISKFLPSLVR